MLNVGNLGHYVINRKLLSEIPLTFTTLWTISADNVFILSQFFQPTEFGILCKLSLVEILYVKCQIQYPEKKIRKLLKKCYLLKIDG